MKSSYKLDLVREAGAAPTVRLLAFNVTTSSQRRTFTSNAEKDITEEYIDMSSIHYEQSIGDDFTPGQIIPSLFRVKIFPDCPVLDGLTPVLNPTSSSDYDTAYGIQIKYKVGNTSYTYRLGGTYILISKSQKSFGSAVQLTFNDELCVLDNYEVDMTSASASTFRAAVSYIFRQGGYDGNWEGNNLIVDGTNYYNGNTMSAKQALSYILQMNGLCIIAGLGVFQIRKLNAGRELMDGGIYTATYSGNYQFDDYKGKWEYALIDTPDSDILIPTGNYPTWYFVEDNPFLSNGNKMTYEATMRDNVKQSSNRLGLRIEYMACPHIEAGDYLNIGYYKSASASNSKSNHITTVEWNGGAFFTLQEGFFEPVRRHIAHYVD